METVPASAGASFTNNLELGAAGVEDGFFHLLGYESHKAAETYADQTAKATGEDKEVILTAAVKAEDSGALRDATDKTVDDVQKKATDAFEWIKPVVYATAIGLVAIASIVAVVQIAPLLRKA